MKKKMIAPVFICAFCLTAFAQANEPVCPSISVAGPSHALRQGEAFPFFAELGKEVENYQVEYIWEISTGKIISGQGTKSIEVMTELGENPTATLTVKGLPEKCPNTASETGSISEPFPLEPILTDEFDMFGRGGTKGRIDNFLIELLKDKPSEGVIVFRDDKDLLRHIKYLRDYIAFRRFARERLTVVISDKDVQPVQFWRVPVSMDLKQWSGRLIIKLEDFEPLQKLFTPKIVRSKTKK